MIACQAHLPAAFNIAQKPDSVPHCNPVHDVSLLPFRKGLFSHCLGLCVSPQTLCFHTSPSSATATLHIVPLDFNAQKL